jgi:hypothetical protein
MVRQFGQTVAWDLFHNLTNRLVREYHFRKWTHHLILAGDEVRVCLVEPLVSPQHPWIEEFYPHPHGIWCLHGLYTWEREGYICYICERTPLEKLR